MSVNLLVCVAIYTTPKHVLPRQAQNMCYLVTCLSGHTQIQLRMRVTWTTTTSIQNTNHLILFYVGGVGGGGVGVGDFILLLPRETRSLPLKNRGVLSLIEAISFCNSIGSRKAIFARRTKRERDHP